jgi:hypothetical protein
MSESNCTGTWYVESSTSIVVHSVYISRSWYCYSTVSVGDAQLSILAPASRPRRLVALNLFEFGDVRITDSGLCLTHWLFVCQ